MNPTTLEVIGMHVLHRPNLPRAVTISTLAAVLTIALMLILATATGNLRSSPSGTPSPASSAPTAHHQAAAPAWHLNPFSPLLGTPVAGPSTVNPPRR
jgi:hypothetical protein